MISTRRCVLRLVVSVLPSGRGLSLILGLLKACSSVKLSAMFPPGRATLYAALFSCAFQISGLGIAATLLVSAPAKFSPPVKVTLLQRTVPLPMQEGQEPASPRQAGEREKVRGLIR